MSHSFATSSFSGGSFLRCLKELFENPDLAAKSHCLLWIHGSIEQMWELALLQNEDFLHLVRPFLLLLEAEENFKAIAPCIFSESQKKQRLQTGLKTALKVASDACATEDSHGLVVLGGLTALFATLISSRSIELEKSFHTKATREEALRFLSQIFRAPIIHYIHPEGKIGIIAYDTTCQRYPIEDDDIPF